MQPLTKPPVQRLLEALVVGFFPERVSTRYLASASLDPSPVPMLRAVAAGFLHQSVAGLQRTGFETELVLARVRALREKAIDASATRSAFDVGRVAAFYAATVLEECCTAIANPDNVGCRVDMDEPSSRLDVARFVLRAATSRTREFAR